jgi:signal transduction histidine kinase
MDRSVIAESTSAAFLAHEVRSLASAIRAALEFMDIDERRIPREKLVPMLKAQADALLRVVDSMLTKSGGHPNVTGVRGAVGLANLVRSIALELESLAVEKGLHVTVSIPADLQTLHVPFDGVAVSRILRNFLANAIKFTRAGWIRLAVENEDGMLAISVTDTGVGMDAKRVSRLFMPYAPGAEAGSGTGLGLWMSSELARALGGHIHVDSEPGTGSRFALLLPVSPLSVPDQVPCEDSSVST